MKYRKIAYIGHAVADENGKTQGGKRGDQTTAEVRIQEWYNRSSGWTNVFRFRDVAKRRVCSESARAICNNDKIGYSQSDRKSLLAEAEKKGFDFSKIEVPCSCDCSSMVNACIRACGVHVSDDMYTGNEAELLRKSGEFFEFTESDYTGSAEKLCVGDILIGKGHTAIVVNSKNVPIFTRELRYKSSGMLNGDDVKLIQEKLIGLCLLYDKADGYFGRKTESAVKLYQRLHMLTVDGIVGTNTYKKMGFVYEKGK